MPLQHCKHLSQLNLAKSTGYPSSAPEGCKTVGSMVGLLMPVTPWPTSLHSLVVSTMSALDTPETMMELVAELGWSTSKWELMMGRDLLISQVIGPAHAMISLVKLVSTSVLLRISQSRNWADM
jgi:hypothetical protein